MRRCLLVFLPAIALAGCFGGNAQVGVSSSPTGGCGVGGCSQSSVGRPRGGLNGGGSTGSGPSSPSTGGASTSGGGSSGGSTSAGAGGGSSSGGCANVACAANPGQLIACKQAPCANPICAQLCDELAGQAGQGLCGAVVQELGHDGQPIAGYSTTTLSDGSFALCPPGRAFTVEARASGYETTDGPEFIGDGDAGNLFFQYYGAALPIFATDEYAALANVLGIAAGDALVGASVVDTSCYDGGGFALGAVLPDGGSLPDGGALPYQVQYVSGGTPSPSLTQTDGSGNGFVFNIDPSLTAGFVAVVATPVGVAAACQGTRQDAAFGLTGLVRVGPSSFSVTAVPIGP